MQYPSYAEEVLSEPEIALRQLFYAHPRRAVYRSGVVIISPVFVDDSTLAHKAVKERGAGVGCENIGADRRQTVAHNKIKRFFENIFSVFVKPKYEGGVEYNACCAATPYRLHISLKRH